MKRVIWVLVILIVMVVGEVKAEELETGGTDFIIYDLGVYGTEPTFANFFKFDYEGGMKTVIGAYDLNPGEAKKRLAAMCQAGQKKLGFTIWFARYIPYGKSAPAYVDDPTQTYPADGLLIINSTGGKLQPRQENNIRNLLNDIEDLQCFNELQIRFTPVGNSFLEYWGNPADYHQPITGWQENVYLENYAFMKYVRNVVKTTLESKNSKIKIFYDLGAEQGGATFEYVNDPDKVFYLNSMMEMYQKRLWRDYTREFGTDDTYGFSIALLPGRLTKLIAMYDAVGIRPNQYAIDIYDVAQPPTGMVSQLEIFKAELEKAGEEKKPVIIQETYFNDSQAFREIMKAKDSLGLNIRTIMQWQAERDKTYRADGSFRHYSTVAADFSYFGARTSRGTITCNPAKINLTENQRGTAEIKSTVTDLTKNWAQICVSADNNQTKAEVSGMGGVHNSNTTEAPWIMAGKDYVFTLSQINVGETDCSGEVLASCTVSGVLATPSQGVTKWSCDTNGDGTVDLVDFSLWKQEYSGKVMTKKADFNKNGTVDLLDFSIWKREYSRE